MAGYYEWAIDSRREIRLLSPTMASQDSLMPRSGLFGGLRRKSYRKVWEFVQHINTSVVTSPRSREWLLHPLVGFQRSSISYALEALTKEQRQDPEPWKVEELRNLMRLSRLRVGLG